MKRILVTGGAGFIGSALCRYLVGEAGASILNIDKLTHASNPRAVESIAHDPRYQFKKLDICWKEGVAEAFASFKPDAVMHLAAETHVDRSINASDAFIQANAVGTYVLLEAARGYWEKLKGAERDAFRFLHVSTDEVYGELGATGKFREDTPYYPSSPYSASKAASDHFVQAWHRTYGLPALITNCSNNYGPYQFPDKLIPLMILNAHAGKPLPIFGDGLNVRDWLYVDDHARALHTVLEKGRVGEKYNIGASNERDNLSLVKQICALMDEMQPAGKPHEKLIAFVADRPGHDRRYALDTTKLEHETGWRAAENFETGLRKTVRWYLDNLGFWQSVQESGDIRTATGR